MRQTPRPSSRRQRRARLIGPLLILTALAALGLSSAFRLFRTAAARAQDLPDFTNGSSDLNAPTAIATPSACDLSRKKYENSLPIPNPTPGVAPNIGYVVQLVNESDVTLLAASNAAHQGSKTVGGPVPPPISILPREGTWLMQPKGKPGSILTIDIPPGWENTICPQTNPTCHALGPLFWPRTGCRYNIAHDHAQCETGTCSSHYDCSKAHQSPIGPKTFTEWTFRDNNRPPLSAPDISVVDGASINVDIEPIGKGFPNQAPAQFSATTWMSPQNLPLTKCGADLRTAGNCPIGQFQLKRQEQGMFIQGTAGGSQIAACFSNCGLYEFQGGAQTGPFAPCPGFRCPGTPPVNCVGSPTDNPLCYFWRSFCCFALPGAITYETKCAPPDKVPSPNCSQNGVCWGARSSTPKTNGVCSCAAFVKNDAGTCPPEICTNQFSLQTPGAQPPFNTCKNAGGPSNACIGDDTIHTVMPRGLTWPNDPQTYFSNARAFRVVFAPGGTSAPITPAGPIPLCSSLPPLYAYNAQVKQCAGDIAKGALFAGAKRGVKCSKLNDPVCKPNNGSCNITTGFCANWGCSIADGVDPAQDQILCQWKASQGPTPTPTRKPTPTPTRKASPTPTRRLGGQQATPTPVASPGAIVTSMSVSEVAAPGTTAGAGSVTIRNDLTVTQSIGSLTIAVSDPALFSSMTLSGAGQSVTVTPPSATTTFTFSSPIALAAGSSVTFSLSAVIAMNSVMLSGEIKYAGLTPIGSLPITAGTWPIAGGLLILGFALFGVSDGTRRRAIVIVVLALGLAAASVGCDGGSSNNLHFASSSQQVTAVNDTAGGVAVTVAGLPAQLGTIAD